MFREMTWRFKLQVIALPKRDEPIFFERDQHVDCPFRDTWKASGGDQVVQSGCRSAFLNLQEPGEYVGIWLIGVDCPSRRCR